MESDLHKAFRFHFEHSGYIVGRRAEGALELARAELWLEDRDGAEVTWEYDDVPYDPGDANTDEEAAAKFESGEWDGPYGAVLRVDGKVEGSLWGIVLSGSGPGRDPYARVIEAELASEYRAELARRAVWAFGNVAVS